MGKELLTAISNWKLEARDDPAEYFYETGSFAEISSGDRIFVIGRKGTGKTAIAEHIQRLNGPKLKCAMQSFKNFPFNELYRFNNENFKRPNRYITIWKYVILTAICKLMESNSRVNYDARDALRKVFTFDLEDAFERRLGRITDRSIEFSALGFGFASGGPAVGDPVSISIEQKSDIILKFIKNNIDDSTYYILFDELDEDYQGCYI